MSIAEAANAKALASAGQRTAASDALVEHIDANLAARHCADADRAKLEKLRIDIAGAQAETQAEVQACQKLQQAYDSEIVTLGAMQKTVNPQGQGELPIQLREFRDDPATAAVFERELGSKGYSIGANVIGKNKDGSADVLYFTDPKNPAAKPITGPALDEFIQTHADRRADTLGPFRALGRTPEFQKKQVLDFNDRLVNATAKKPAGYVHEIGDYVSLEKASALVLDQDVNRPGYVRTDFGQALDKFYAGHPSAPKDPGLWTSAQRAAFEPVITDNYSALRRGTDTLNRAAKLGQAGLSEVPGSLEYPP